MTSQTSTQATTTAVNLKGLRVSHRRYIDIKGTIVHVSGIDGTLTVRWDSTGEESDAWTAEELVVSLADLLA
jgi:hypothetical protein